jgi:hypothetical protein
MKQKPSNAMRRRASARLKRPRLAQPTVMPSRKNHSDRRIKVCGDIDMTGACSQLYSRGRVDEIEYIRRFGY